jgi:ABC-2 type transport system ATP-binding protein
MIVDRLPPLAADRPIVATHELMKRWGKLAVLDRAEMTVPRGAFYLLAGVNGTGKSTLLHILMDLVRPNHGRAEVLGIDPQRAAATARASIGYVPANRPLYPDRLPLARTLAHLAAHYSTWDASYGTDLIRALGVPLRRPARSATPSEVQRFRWVAALAHRPPLLLLDEPFAGLDDASRDAALALLADHLATTDTTVILSTHDITAAASLADHFGILHAGRFMMQARLDTLLEHVRRYRVAIDTAWQPPAALADATLERTDGQRVIEWTVWGPQAWAVEAFRAGGGAVADIETLSAAQALRMMLRTTGSAR